MNVIRKMYFKHFVFCSVFLLVSIFSPEVFAQKAVTDYNPQQTYQDGVLLFQQQQYGAAISKFGQLLKTLPDPNAQPYIDARYYEAVSALYLEREDAQLLIADFAADYPSSSWMPRIHFLYAGILFDNRKYPDALEHYNQINPNILSATEQHEMLFKKAYALMQQDQADEAVHLFKQVMEQEGPYQEQATYYYAHHQYIKGNDDEALKYFARISRNRAFSKQIPLYEMQINYRKGDNAAVIQQGEEAFEVADNRRKPEIAHMLADAWYQQGDYAKAMEYYTIYERQNRRKMSRTDHYQIGISKLKTGDAAAAIRNFQEVSGTDDSLTQFASYYLAECYVKTDQPKFAKNAFLAAYHAKFDPEISEDALFNYAKLSLQSGPDPFNESITLLQEFLAAHPDSKRRTEANEYLIHLYLQSRNYDEALSSLETISNRNPELQKIYDQLLYSLSVELFNKGDYDKAISYFTRLLNSGAAQQVKARATFWLAEAYYYKQNYWEAEKYFKQFVSSRTAASLDIYPLASYNLGYTFYKKEDYAAAIPSFRQFLSRPYTANPKLVYDAWLRLGDCEFMMRNYKEAIAAYDKVANARQAESDYALFQKGLAYGAQGNFNAKVSALDQLVKTYPRSVYYDNALYEIGSTYLVTNDNRSAIASYDKLVREKPRSVHAREALLKTGLMYYNNNQADQALSKLKKVVEDYPSTDEAREAVNVMRNIYMETNKLQEFFAYTGKIGIGELSNNQQDSLAFAAAENFYLSGNCDDAAKALENYFNQQPSGGYLLKAHYYASQCALKQQNKAGAIPHLQFIIDYPVNDYTDQALLEAARIAYDGGDFKQASGYYERLSQLTENPQQKLESFEGSMKSFYFGGNYDQSIAIGYKLLQTEGITATQTVQAHYIIGKSLFEKADYPKATTALDICQKLDQSAFGAEAAYLAAESTFKTGKYAETENRIFEMADRFAAYEYWVAKGFILLADVYVKNDNAFQAKETLKSIIKNYKGEDLKQLAAKKLKEIESADGNK